jgi:hypothetical protein
MNQTDREKLLVLLPQVCAFYKQDFSKFLGGVWVAAMAPYSFAEVSDAITRHTMNPDSGQFMPRPADVVKMLGGTSTDVALAAWSKVERAVRSVGQYESVIFDDPLIHRVVEDMGGWVKLCSFPSEDDFVFVAKEFQNRYRGFAMRSERPPYPSGLVGLAHATNREQGQVDQVRYRMLGDSAKCQAVYQHGVINESSQIAMLDVVKALPRLTAPSTYDPYQ